MAVVEAEEAPTLMSARHLALLVSNLRVRGPRRPSAPQTRRGVLEEDTVTVNMFLTSQLAMQASKLC